jgi:hypothetical protein
MKILKMMLFSAFFSAAAALISTFDTRDPPQSSVQAKADQQKLKAFLYQRNVGNPTTGVYDTNLDATDLSDIPD